VLSRGQLQKLENYEMEKFKKLNEDVLDDETHPELIDVCKKLLDDLTEITEKFRVIAKARGYRYDIGKKKSSIDVGDK